LYLASSSDDRRHLTRQLADLLEKRTGGTVKLHYQPMPAETHATIYHPAALAAIRVLFKPQALARAGSPDISRD
jgi:predicted alpha/beta superfamily hydrolase